VNVVLEFLTELYEEGLGYSAINTARSALSAVMKTDNGKTVGADPRVVRFLKGVFELRTPMPKYKDIWDVNILLQFFRNMKENKDLSLKELTKKLCALLLISTAQRVQTLCFINIGCIKIDKDECRIHIAGKLKHTRVKFKQKPLELKCYPEQKLCVVCCLKEYISRTKELRNQQDQLLLCYQKPNDPASKASIARWLGSTLTEAGISGYAPHSFRGASSSAMLCSGISVEDIMKSAGWSNASTFHKFYNKPLVSETVKEKP
jgi:site-specific recombinase XerD